MVCGLIVVGFALVTALSVMVTVAFSTVVPDDGGVKVTENVQLLPELIGVPVLQLLALSVKYLLLLIVIALVINSGVGPLLVSVNVSFSVPVVEPKL